MADYGQGEGVAATVLSQARCILLVEDDETFRSVLAASLARRGYRVYEAEDAASALGWAGKVVPDYVVLDIQLRGESGLTLIEPLRALLPEARVVILTGLVNIPAAVWAIKRGAHQYLTKPVDSETILRALQEDELPYPPPTGNDDVLKPLERRELDWLQRALADHGGSVSATARALNLHRRTLQRKLARFNHLLTGIVTE